MLNKIKKLFTVDPEVVAVVEPVVVVKPKTVRKPRAKKVVPVEASVEASVEAPTAKQIATDAGEPYVNIVQIELDPENIGNGAFELDWNDKFITKLVRAGYQQKANESEDIIVDRWFQTICRNVVQENYEQWEANQPADARPREVNRTDLGGGITETS